MNPVRLIGAAAVSGLLLHLVSPPVEAATRRPKVVVATLTVTSPTNYRIFQRNGSDRANIPIGGRYTGNPTAIQARWKLGPWTTIATNLPRSQGNFYGVLRNQPTGQGTLQVRFANLTGLIRSVYQVGVGDIFVMAGQSNMSGRGVTDRQYSPATVRASLLGNDYRWKELRDPYDTGLGQVDKISLDPDSRLGSWVAQFTNIAIRQTNAVPVAFIPCARGGSTIAQWARSTSRSTLYGSMLNRVKASGGKARAVLWFQGENDSNTSSETYRSALNSLVNSMAADFKAPTIAAVIGSAPYEGTHRAGVRMGTLSAIEENDNLLLGPAFYDINIDDEGGDGLHFKSEQDLIYVGTRWWHAVNEVLYGGSRGHGPVLAGATRDSTSVRLEFDESLGTITANEQSFWVMSGSTRYPVESFAVEDNAITLQMFEPLPDDVTASMGHDNRSCIDRAVYGPTGLPAVPFHNKEITTS